MDGSKFLGLSLTKRFLGLVAVVAATIEPGNPGLAQLVPDATLGSQASTITTKGTIQTISGGDRVGGNLFHSFREFNVEGGRSVYFSDPGVSNILTRVTGANRSNINGRLGVNGNANLFLINPNGIVFGAGASLDIRGSFVATTASAVKFSDGSVFSATAPTVPNLLTIAVPIGLQLGTNQPEATITNHGNLTVGQDLTLVADRLHLQGSLQAGRDLTLQAQETLRVRDSITEPFRAIAGRNLTMQGNASVDILALSHPQTQIQAGNNLTLVSDGTISGDARFVSQGTVQIHTVSGGLATFTSVYDPIITATGDVDLALNYSGASLLVEAGGKIRLQGNVNITTPDVVAPFVGDDAALNSQPGLILRSGQTTLRYSGNSGTVAGSSTGTSLVPNAGIALQGDVTIAPGGVVRLTTGTGDISTQAITAQAGTIALTSDRAITTNGQPLNVGTASGNAGSMRLTALKGDLSTGDLIASSADAVNFGNGGAVTIATAGTATLGSIHTEAATGEGANLDITAGGAIKVGDIISYSYTIGNSGNVQLLSGGSIALGSIDTGSEGGQSGNATITAAGDLTATKFIDTSTYGAGDAGTIAIAARSLFLNNGAQIRSRSVSGATGNGGAIRIDVADTIALAGVGAGGTPSAIFTLADLYSTGNGGDITINTGSLVMRDGSEILANHFGEGVGTRAGNITIRVQDTISLDGFRVRPVEGDSPGTGIASNVSTGLNSIHGINRQGGTIDIQAGGLAIRNGAYISSSLEFGANGQGGNIRLKINHQGTPGNLVIAGSATRESGIFSRTTANSVGNGGNIQIEAGAVSLQANATIGAEANGVGTGGQIGVQATSLTIGNRSAINAGTTTASDAGAITLASDRLTLTEGGQIRAQTQGQGQGGDIQIQATDVTVTGALSGIISGSGSPVRRGDTAGNGGDIRLTTDTLNVTDRGMLSASTFTDGQSGRIEVTANAIALASGGQLAATTEGRGNAGSITVNARDRVTIAGVPSGLFASTGPQSSGNGGSIDVTTGTLRLQDRARITVDSRGSGNGGDIQLSANQVNLDTSTIFAGTASTQGGNIQIQARDLLLLRHNSLLSASAGTAKAGGNGGNITIHGGFIVGVLRENSDIRANAFTGNGGQVTIEAQGIFGLQFQPKLTPFSDITASSQFGSSGSVTITTPNTDPSRGLVQLPGDFFDSTKQIAQTCSAQQQGNSFVVTGRGGLSSDPTEALNQTIVWMDEGQGEQGKQGERGRQGEQGEQGKQGERGPQGGQEEQGEQGKRRGEPGQDSIVEMTGWIRHTDGSVSLVADTGSALSSIVAQSCQPQLLEKP